MDRLSQLRGGAGGSRDVSLDGSAAGDSFLTANDTPSKYFSLSEDESFDLSKDVTLAAPPPSQHSLNEDCLISNLSPIGKKDILDYKIGKQIEAANILSGGVDIFDDNENSYDGNELVIDDNVDIEDKSPSLKSPESSDLQFHKSDEQLGESTLMEDMGGSKETEVVLQIDGRNVDAINIGNGLYLYRKEGQEELAAVQIIDDDQQQPSFKFLKVRENTEGNLEVYEEIEIEVPKEVPVKEGKSTPQSTSHVPIKGINKVISDPGCSKVVEKKINIPEKETPIATPKKLEAETSKDAPQSESVTELNLNGKMVKISEARKSPLMAYHSTPNKEGIPLTKTMVDQQLQPSRHSDNIKKTIEVHTDSCKQRILETPTKSKEVASPEKCSDKSLEVDKLVNNEDPDEKVPSEAKIEMVPVVIESKSNEVIDSGNADSTANKKVEVNKPLTDKVKQFVRSQSASINAESKLPVQDKELQKVDEDTITVPSGSLDTNKKNKTDAPISVNKSDKDKDGAVKDIIIESEVTDAKINKNREVKEKDIQPTEIIESEEIEIDENVLIIEEDAINHQPETPTPKENDIKQVAPSVETKVKVVEDQMKNQQSKEEKEGSVEISSQSVSIESKEKTLGITEKSSEVQKSPSTINETKEICLDLVDNSSKNVKTKLESPSISKKDVIQTDNAQIKETLKSLGKAEVPESKREVIRTDNTQVKETVKNIDKVEPPTSKQEEKTEKASNSQSQKDSTEIKSVVNSSVSEVKVKNSVGTSFKQEKITPKVENVPQNTDNSGKKDKIFVNDLKTSTVLPNKEQSQINLPKNTQNIVKPGVVKSDVKPIVVTASEIKTVINHKSESAKTSLVDVKPKSINNNHAPVPFGQWTEANRQDFLNKIKESKVPVNSSNSNQLKQPNDLNRRDVLKKIDSQRQTYNVKVQESLQKSSVKTETAFASKAATKHEIKTPGKSEAPVKPKPIVIKKPVQETVKKVQPEPPATVSSTTKQEPRRKEINNQELIDKTIEGIINRAVTGKGAEDVKQVDNPVAENSDKILEQQVNSQPTLLDAIEIKMNELHGIPFVERPPHELPRPHATEPQSPKTEDPPPQKVTKIPNLLPLTKTQQKLKECEDDIMKHEPVQENIVDLTNVSKTIVKPEASENSAQKDKIITENEFDKFARRNSVTYENCLTVTDTQQLIQTVVPRDVPPKKISRNEQMLAEAKAKSPHKHQAVRQYQPSKGSSKYAAAVDAQSKQYHSKLQMAYQTALTAKRRIDSPITIIEDKPVKVVYMEPSAEFTHLNAQGRDLSPAKRAPEPDTLTVGTCDSLDSDVLDAIEDVKAQEETKTKSKHQRKQVLTPVENPDLELIEPGDLGIEVSPKKKRKTEPEKGKNLVPKKSYLLGRSAPRAETASEPIPTREAPNPVAPLHNDPVSAIDNLVKAAELLENQSESMSADTSVPNVDSPQSTPVKRGRGRPRKNPLPDGAPAAKAPSPQKQPRLAARRAASSSAGDSSDDDALIKENWTMGKINENIVCPICSKLFRSENVVFKHVKHCTGPSPSRSESDKRSPRRRSSRDDDRPRRAASPARSTRKRKSKDSGKSSSSDDVVPVESDPKETEKEESQKSTKTKLLATSSNLVCEICGKSFRQLSYLVSHKLQHKKDEPKRPVAESRSDKSVFSCETCKKEFRKLHHLVQHRLIHNPVPPRALRKTSSEQKEISKAQEAAKADDPSAGFRCEPCDKSFRKLHHLVEHRETHDGINRQRSNSVTQVNPEKPAPPPQCEICKKTFRKLHHLIEHKEQHLDTSSEKSDDQKSVKSSLSTKDIIHECNLCYMVFPNEHSLTKHTVICLRKKRQSAAKQAAQEDKSGEEGTNASKTEEGIVEITDEPQPMETDVVEKKTEILPETITIPPAKVEVPEIKEELPKTEKENTADKSVRRSVETKTASVKKITPVPENPPPTAAKKAVEILPKIKQVDEIIVIEDTPKKKAPVKERMTPSVTKRQRAVAPTPAVEERTAAVSSSDDDEIRYMLNPDFKIDETAEGKNFMKVRAKKRSSLQIERPNSKDLVRRRSLLQHPPKIPRLRAKSDDSKVASANPLPKTAVKPKLDKIEQVPSTDSDDSDVKYMFPKTAPEKPSQSVKQEPAADKEKIRRKTMAEKRKSLSGIAKRKSVGKAVVKPTSAPAKTIKHRTPAVEHRCDCGQLFSSAALLARHAVVAHTPPRRRRTAPAPPPRPCRAPEAAPAPTPRAARAPPPRTRLHAGVPTPERRPRK